MGDLNGEPLYCPLCGTLPSALEDPRRICESCGQSMKEMRYFGPEDVARLRRIVGLAYSTALNCELCAGWWDRDDLDRLAALIGDSL